MLAYTSGVNFIKNVQPNHIKVWREILHMSKTRNFGEKIKTKPYSLELKCLRFECFRLRVTTTLPTNQLSICFLD